VTVLTTPKCWPTWYMYTVPLQVRAGHENRAERPATGTVPGKNAASVPLQIRGVPLGVRSVPVTGSCFAFRIQAPSA
jgi:hypothetical protein